MTKPALKVNWETYLYLENKHRERRCKEWNMELKPISEKRLKQLEKDFNRFADKNGMKEIWDDTFCFSYNELKELLDNANMEYEETTIECCSL